MKKFYVGLTTIFVSALFSRANAQDYDAQIDALQNELLKIKQEIIIDNLRYKKIILGKNGDKIKQISMQARQEIERYLGKKIHLYLFIKQKKKNTAIELIE